MITARCSIRTAWSLMNWFKRLTTMVIRCFYWILIRFGTVAVSAFVLALIFIGIDVYTLITQDELGGINLIAHVSGAALGFLLGFSFFRAQKRQIVID